MTGAKLQRITERYRLLYGIVCKLGEVEVDLPRKDTDYAKEYPELLELGSDIVKFRVVLHKAAKELIEAMGYSVEEKSWSRHSGATYGIADLRGGYTSAFGKPKVWLDLDELFPNRDKDKRIYEHTLIKVFAEKLDNDLKTGG